MKRWIHASEVYTDDFESTATSLLKKLQKGGYGLQFYWDGIKKGPTEASMLLGGHLSDDDIEALISGYTIDFHGHEVRVEYEERI